MVTLTRRKATGSGTIRPATNNGSYSFAVCTGSADSGVFLFGKFEVQVFESYQSGIYADGQAAAIYGQYPPLVNACRKPGEWQTYDFIWEPPDSDHLRPAYVTIIHNGVVVQNHFELFGITDGITRLVPGKYPAPHPPEVFIQLQYHNNPLRYRNIWIRRLGEQDKP